MVGETHCCCSFGLHCREHGLVAPVQEVELREVQTGKVDAVHVAIKLSQMVTPAWPQECGEYGEGGWGMLLTLTVGGACSLLSQWVGHAPYSHSGWGMLLILTVGGACSLLSQWVGHAPYSHSGWGMLLTHMAGPRFEENSQ